MMMMMMRVKKVKWFLYCAIRTHIVLYTADLLRGVGRGLRRHRRDLLPSIRHGCINYSSCPKLTDRVTGREHTYIYTTQWPATDEIEPCFGVSFPKMRIDIDGCVCHSIFVQLFPPPFIRDLFKRRFAPSSTVRNDEEEQRRRHTWRSSRAKPVRYFPFPPPTNGTTAAFPAFIIIISSSSSSTCRKRPLEIDDVNFHQPTLHRTPPQLSI